MSAKALEYVNNDDIPILCSKCLGNDKAIRMKELLYDKECKLCQLPFTSYKWKLSSTSKQYLETHSCKKCASTNDMCQCCLLDLVYHLPIHLSQQMKEIKTSNTSITNLMDHNKKKTEICTLYLQGTCKLGNSCPYKHDIADTNLYNPNKKIHIDPNNTTLYLGNLTEKQCTEKKILKLFNKYKKWIVKLRIISSKKIAFITFNTHNNTIQVLNSISLPSSIRCNWSNGIKKEHLKRSLTDNNNSTNPLKKRKVSDIKLKHHKQPQQQLQQPKEEEKKKKKKKKKKKS